MKYLLLFLLPFHLFSQQDSLAIKYANTINTVDLKKHLYTIAADDYEGRETGMDGQKKAAAYLASQFQSYGIGPVNNTYFQKFPLVLAYSHGVSIKTDEKDFKFMKDFYCFNTFENQKIELKELLFAGYGISSPNYDDYLGLEVKNKVLVIKEGEPVKKGVSVITQKEEASIWLSDYQKKANYAKDKGVKALIILTKNLDLILKNEGFKHYIEDPKMLLEGDYLKDASIPVIYTNEKTLNQLLFETEKNDFFTKTFKKIDKKGKPKSQNIILPKEVTIDINRPIDHISSENVLGFIEGSDLKDEVIVLTAHYDHIGIEGGEVFNGADDDGSGTVALLELAQAFQIAKKEGNGPRRSVLIMPVSGEEKGLLGSKYYSENPVFPLENTVADLNIDMIGRIDKKHEGNANYVYLIGSDKLSTELHDISEKANSTYTKIDLDYTYNDTNDPNRYYYRSDHYNFAKHGIPVIFYFNGTHEDYHKVTDTVDKIDFDKIENITKLVFFTAWDLVNRDDKIKVNVENDFKNER